MADVTRAIAAATSVAASLDLQATDAIVLQNSNRLALRLVPCDILARVAHARHEAAQLEVDLARRLAEVGCPVASWSTGWIRTCTRSTASKSRSGSTTSS